ncbi:MBL fold metallo-hydrolase [Flavobacterium sp. NST-5]|uniref:MBL fold metallo-hydrolase n=1 Tax=Flavobacterium ichthyis TaxID=2698827 RepID=A0ABW9Z8E6_9FLAO|nr:MBL fold metallo-hydrolase [Flavobacterium ichthyis]NBL64114.1 MBL fold metallo-hydrolase [Flavobacterium ichthyis]
MKIVSLHQGNFSLTSQKKFKSVETTINSTKRPVLGVQPFLIKTPRDLILLDTGLADQPLPKDIKSLLQQHQLQTQQVTKVLISHLHKDHAGGIGEVEGQSFKENFPNAKIYIQEREYKFAMSQVQNPSYDIEQLQHFKTLPNIVWLQDDLGIIDPNITFEVTKGHTPYHQVFWIKGQHQTIFFGADELPKKSYFNRSIAYKTDYDGIIGKQLRNQWKQQANNENWIILYYHDSQN